jgi:hypothetical protein
LDRPFEAASNLGWITARLALAPRSDLDILATERADITDFDPSIVIEWNGMPRSEDDPDTTVRLMLDLPNLSDQRASESYLMADFEATDVGEPYFVFTPMAFGFTNQATEIAIVDHDREIPEQHHRTHEHETD